MECDEVGPYFFSYVEALAFMSDVERSFYARSNFKSSVSIWRRNCEIVFVVGENQSHRPPPDGPNRQFIQFLTYRNAYSYISSFRFSLSLTGKSTTEAPDRNALYFVETPAR